MAQNALGAGLLSAAAIAAGLTIGAIAERKLVRPKLETSAEPRFHFGSLRGETTIVRTVDNVDIHVEVDTPVDFDPLVHPTVVFSHGYSLNHDTWHFQREALRPTARLVFWDQRSHGRSGRGSQDSHTIDQLGHDLRRVIDDVVPEGNLVLVGHSMGGMTVMSLAASYPELFTSRVTGVGLLGTSSGRLSEVLLGLPAPIARSAHRLAPVVAENFIRRKDVIELARQRTSDFSKLMAHRYSFASDVDPEIADFCFDMINATPIDVVGEFLPTFDKHDKRAALDIMQGIETLVMVGTHDKMTPLEHSYEIVRRVPHAELVVLSETGHMLMLERPTEVNIGLEDLLQRARRAEIVP